MSDSSLNNKNNKRTSSRFDSSWLIILVIITSVVMTTVMLNNKKQDETIESMTSTVDIDNGDQKINWEKYDSHNMELSETITIANSGIYYLTGSIEDGSININVGNGVVKLVLNNVSITNSNGPAIYCSSADDLVIELKGENKLSDSAKYSDEFDEDVTGAIYSKADLTFEGDGTLEIMANFADGIVGKDDLKFNSGKYNITANDDGIRGKDSVYIVNGEYTINSKADAIKSTNDTDFGKGFILIEDGSFQITASGKGIKATKNVFIKGGAIAIKSYDDAIHSDNYVGISDGLINITSSDDGIHANSNLLVEGGTINIPKAYEGLEAQVIVINDGKISLQTSDDGINAGGGADSSSQNRPGANPFDADENCSISINGGEVYINSSGDGIDSNGLLTINGGTVVVDGPTNNGNGALDAGMGIIMNGGEAIAIGASGMAESLGANSTVNNLSIYLSETYPAKTKIEIVDQDGNAILSHTSAKSFNHIAAGSKDFELGSKYTIMINDNEYQTITITDITTTNSTRNYNYQNPMPGNPKQSK